MTEYRIPILDKWEWQEPVLDKDLTSPPGGESKGDRYLIYGSGSGAWSGQNGNIAEYNGSGWTFISKREGMVVYVKDEDKYYYYVSAWGVFGQSGYSGYSGTSGYSGVTPSFGAWATSVGGVALALTTVYHPTTDGFLVFNAICSDNSHNIQTRFDGYTDGNSSPTTIRVSCYIYGHQNANWGAGENVGFTIPVRANDYFKIIQTDNAASPTFTYTMYWIPLG